MKKILLSLMSLIFMFGLANTTNATSPTWDVTGTYSINVNYLNVNYPETLILTQSGTTITGVSLDTIPPASLFTITGGSVIGNDINIDANMGSLVIHMVGTIAPNGSMGGTWADITQGTRTGTWITVTGAATLINGNSIPGLDRYLNNPGRIQAGEAGAQCGSGAGSGAFGYFGKDLNMAGGANGTQTGLNNSAVCGNRQGNL